ncbi:procollagen-proline 4-dioxygenase [Aureococcus anophagefferens]|nr:procollagen-proline 4-dioxygenase [Aureococcus anophagefferens]
MTRLALLLFTRPATGWLWSSSKEDTEASVVPSFGEGQMARLDDLSPSSLEAALSTSGAIVMGLEAGAVDAVAAAAYAAFQRKDLDAFDGYARAASQAFVFGRPGTWLSAAPDAVAAAAVEVFAAFRAAYGKLAEDLGRAGAWRCAFRGKVHVHANTQGDWVGADLAEDEALVGLGGLWPIWTNGEWPSAGHRLSLEGGEGGGGGAVSVALIAGPLGQDDPLKPFPGLGPKWESSEANYRVSAVSIYGDPAPAPEDPAPECATTEARGVRVRGRLNGDMGSALVGPPVHPCEFADFDSFLRTSCLDARKTTLGRIDLAGDHTGPALVAAEYSDCEPAHGARAFDAEGNRLNTMADLLALARKGRGVVGYPAKVSGDADATWDAKAAADVWLVPSGVHFVWPTVRTGHATVTDLADAETGVDAGHRSVVTTLSMRPQVFRISQFMMGHETEKLIERNKPRIKPSEVGLVGRSGDKTRTSTNAWDTASPVARDVIGRAFRLLKIDAHRKLEDGLQVLHYERPQWYKPHVDYFTSRNAGGGGASEDAFSNAIPTANNGTNRFATVFLYLNNAGSGGETVFPLSTTHEIYQGGRLTQAGTNRTPGFIRDADAAWVCDTKSEALRVTPRTGDSVLFYSQRGAVGRLLAPRVLPDGRRRRAANLWVWNRPRDAIDKAKAKAKAGIECVFTNKASSKVALYWDDGGDLAPQGDIPPGQGVTINTFPTHKFTAFLGDKDGARLGSWTMRQGLTKIDVGVGR